jgi:hypothetical protein
MKHGKSLVGDREPQEAPAPKQAVSNCAAYGCPLPGTIRPENGDAVCSVHFLADRGGWPHATAVIEDCQTLYSAARRASSMGTPAAADTDLANLLFKTAKAHGIELSEGQLEQARLAKTGPGGFPRQYMPVRMAGAMVEAAIATKAVQAAVTAPVSDADHSHEKERDGLANLLRGLTNNLTRHAA